MYGPDKNPMQQARWQIEQEELSRLRTQTLNDQWEISRLKDELAKHGADPRYAERIGTELAAREKRLKELTANEEATGERLARTLEDLTRIRTETDRARFLRDRYQADVERRISNVLATERRGASRWGAAVGFVAGTLLLPIVQSLIASFLWEEWSPWLTAPWQDDAVPASVAVEEDPI